MSGNSWRDRIKVHPAADLFPMIEGDELIALGEDIRKHGLRQPIVFHAEDTRPDTDDSYKAGVRVSQVIAAKNALQLPLLDGRNRLAAMEAVGILDDARLAGVVSASRTHWGNDISPTDYVVTVNLRRRHLTAEQKRVAIAALLKAHPEHSDRAIAKTAKASDKTVTAVRREAEASAEIPHISPTERVGVDGKQSRARKTLPKTPSGPRVPLSQARDTAIVGFAAILHSQLPKTLDDLTRLLADARHRIAELPLQKRIVLACGYLNALGIGVDDLRPVGLGDAGLTAALNTSPAPDQKRPTGACPYRGCGKPAVRNGACAEHAIDATMSAAAKDTDAARSLLDGGAG